MSFDFSSGKCKDKAGLELQAILLQKTCVTYFEKVCTVPRLVFALHMASQWCHVTGMHEPISNSHTSTNTWLQGTTVKPENCLFFTKASAENLFCRSFFSSTSKLPLKRAFAVNMGVSDRKIIQFQRASCSQFWYSFHHHTLIDHTKPSAFRPSVRVSETSNNT